MNIETFSEKREIALTKWREYRQAVKSNHSNPVYKDLAKAYNQIKNGKKLIDIIKIIQKGGVHENFHPKLAIARATSKKVTCVYYRNPGLVKYLNNADGWREKEYAHDVVIEKCFPENENFGRWDKLRLEAPVPMIPPKCLPDKLTDDYYILWEVDEWKMIPATDPYLLRRISKNLFVVVNGWDLTDLEKTVMAGRMY